MESQHLARQVVASRQAISNLTNVYSLPCKLSLQVLCMLACGQSRLCNAWPFTCCCGWSCSHAVRPDCAMHSHSPAAEAASHSGEEATSLPVPLTQQLHKALPQDGDCSRIAKAHHMQSQPATIIVQSHMKAHNDSGLVHQG